MDRDQMLSRLQGATDPWDFIIIGGGATGLGAAIDAASRGYQTLLLEQSDFAKGTSSRSTKLVHGGVRYLQRGNISLVLEALRERGLLRQNAPHLVNDLPFIVPNYRWWEAAFYGIGLRLYDILAGKHGFGRSRHLSREKTLQRLPTLQREGLRGGVVYHDGQFDDARLAIHMAQTAAEQGATLLNYAQVTALTRGPDDMIRGLTMRDLESGAEHELAAKAVINATGVFSDAIRRMEDPDAKPMIAPSRGVHIVLDRAFLPGGAALMVPHTDDGRVLFAIPWHGRVLVGTTDTPVEDAPLEPRALDEEVAFLLKHATRYLAKGPTRADVLCVFAGLRPLVETGGKGEGDTKSISRDHTLRTSRGGLVTIAGGKWTTYRRMAQDTIDQAAAIAGLQPRACVTQTLALHGAHPDADQFGDLACYGNDAPALGELAREDPQLAQPLEDALPCTGAQVVWAGREEMARTVEDVLARRTRCLLLDARASARAAPRVAALLARELGRDQAWQDAQITAYRALAAGYTLD